MEYAETPIFAGNMNTRSAIVCNCTKADPSADAGVWVVTLQQEPPPKDPPAPPKSGVKHGRPVLGDKLKIQDFQPGPGQDFYYLAGGACTGVGPGSVMLRTADFHGEKWGVWQLDAGGKP